MIGFGNVNARTAMSPRPRNHVHGDIAAGRNDGHVARRRQGAKPRKIEEFAVMLDDIAAPQLAQDFDGFIQAAAPRVEIDAVHVELVLHPADLARESPAFPLLWPPPSDYGPGR